MILVMNFYYFTSEMEEKGLLNPGNEVDLYCLHYVAFGLLQNSIHQFLLSWNHHSLGTEGEKTPVQLFIKGLYNLAKTETPGHPYTELEQVMGFKTCIYRKN